MDKIHDKLFPEGTKFLTTEQRKRRMKQLGYLKLICTIISTCCLILAVSGFFIPLFNDYSYYFFITMVSFLVLKRILAVIVELHINAEIRNERYEKTVADYKKHILEITGDPKDESKTTDSN